MGQERARDSCGKGRIYVAHGGKDSRTTLVGRRSEGRELGQMEGVGLLNCQWPRGWVSGVIDGFLPASKISKNELQHLTTPVPSPMRKV